MTCFARGVCDDVDVVDARFARRRDHACRQHAHGCRLARAVRSEQTEDLAATHLEIEIVDGAQHDAATPEDLGQVRGQDRVGRRVRGMSCARDFDGHRTPLIWAHLTGGDAMATPQALHRVRARSAAPRGPCAAWNTGPPSWPWLGAAVRTDPAESTGRRLLCRPGISASVRAGLHGLSLKFSRRLSDDDAELEGGAGDARAPLASSADLCVERRD